MLSQFFTRSHYCGQIVVAIQSGNRSNTVVSMMISNDIDHVCKTCSMVIEESLISL